VRIYKLLEQIVIFVVDVLDIILSKNICHKYCLEWDVVGINVVFRVIDAWSR
jgi:hypothetical protein